MAATIPEEPAAPDQQSAIGQVKKELTTSGAPVARFFGHAVATLLGLLGLSLISLLTYVLVLGLEWLGVEKITRVMKSIEDGLLYFEAGFFILMIGIGTIELIASEVGIAYWSVKGNWAAAKAKIKP